MNSKDAKICIIGLGYVGLPLAVEFGKIRKTLGFDINPQRIENFEKFLSIVSKNTGIAIDQVSYISPLWTYKLITLLSVLMITGELFAYLS